MTDETKPAEAGKGAAEKRDKRESAPAAAGAAEKKDKRESAPGAAGTAEKKEKRESASPAAEAAGAGAGEAGAAKGEGEEKAKVRSKASRVVGTGVAHINATFNNTQVTITDPKGAVLAWSSSGRMGFKGTRKSTAYAATVVAQDAARQVSAYRMHEVEVRVQGPGAGRESAIRALQASGIMVSLIKDVTPIPHNGCRPRKRRRV